MKDRQVLLVTGAGRGIGAAIARLAAARGYAVGVNYRSDADSAGRVVAEIEAAGGRALALPGDVSRDADVLEIFAALDGEFGPLTALVNNAGITGGTARIEAVTQEQIEKAFAVNVIGAFLCAREAVKRMSTAHGGQGGAIVNISSGAAKLGSPGVYVHYAATKGALDSFTLGMAREVAAEGIRVNSLRVGITDTDIHGFAANPDKLARLSRIPPMQRVAAPEEIAESALWLLSDQASYVTAALIDAGGGM
ncbi:MAG: SDR family oxidoreductase [Rhodovibrionaceae bacterium]